MVQITNKNKGITFWKLFFFEEFLSYFRVFCKDDHVKSFRDKCCQKLGGLRRSFLSCGQPSNTEGFEFLVWSMSRSPFGRVLSSRCCVHRR